VNPASSFISPRWNTSLRIPPGQNVHVERRNFTSPLFTFPPAPIDLRIPFPLFDLISNSEMCLFSCGPGARFWGCLRGVFGGGGFVGVVWVFLGWGWGGVGVFVWGFWGFFWPGGWGSLSYEMCKFLELLPVFFHAVYKGKAHCASAAFLRSLKSRVPFLSPLFLYRTRHCRFPGR